LQIKVPGPICSRRRTRRRRDATGAVGTIESGKLADLVLLDGNPVSDIEALGHVDLVMKEGRIVYRRDPHATQIQ
jgi:imidazolonepropionase-like amidohydrolase